MTYLRGIAVVGRSALTWLAASAATAGLGALALPSLTAPLPAVVTFDEAVVRVASAAVAGSAGWGWVAVTVVVIEALAGTAWRPAAAAAPGWLRRLVLAACGVALLAAATPAAATPGEVHVGHVAAGHADDRRHSGGSAELLTGLPLPDRPVRQASPRRRPPIAEHAPGTTVVVSAGDCLWSIAAAALPPTASAVEIDALWRRIHALNRSAIGPDPNLVHPGLQLLIPPKTGR